MAMRKAECVEELIKICFEDGFDRIAAIFLEMIPMEGEDCMRAFWNKASVGSIRRFTEMMTDDEEIQLPADILADSDIPDDFNDIEIHDFDEEYNNRNIQESKKEEDDYFDL